MRKSKYLIAILGVFLLGLIITGCNKKPTDSSTVTPPTSGTPGTSVVGGETTYTVEFFVGDTLYGSAQTVAEGGKVTKPTDPTMAEDDEFTYTFDNWYKVGSTTPWNFETDVVTANTELFAEFNEVAKVYDLSVWVYGGSSTIYINEAEFNQVKSEAQKAFSDKKLYFKYVTNTNNDGFNASVRNAKSNKPDVVISGSKMDSGDAALTVKQFPVDESTTKGKVKVGLGWFASTTRYIGVLSTSDKNLALATEFYEKMQETGPDYIVYESLSLPVRVGQTKTLVPTLATGEERTPTYVSKNPEIATVDENGVVTGIATGDATVTATLGVVEIELTIKVLKTDYDLVVYVYGSTASTTYITEDESNYIKEQFLALSNIPEDDIYWNYEAGIGNDDFNAIVNQAIAESFIVDVVISGNKLDNGDVTSISVSSTNGKKAQVGAAWFENTSRKVAITEAASKNVDNAKALYNMLLGISPKYNGVVLDKKTAEVETGDTVSIVASSNTEVTWTSSDPEVATVVDGVVTAIKAGTVTITATNTKDESATCTITVTEPPAVEQVLIVWIYGVNGAAIPTTYITEAESNAMRDAFLTASGLDAEAVTWHYSVGLTNPNFNIAVNDAGNVDVVISGNKLDNDTTSVVLHETYGKVSVGAGWFANGSRYVGVTSVVDPEHLTNAQALYNMVSSVSPFYEGVTLNRTSATLEIEETVTLVATAYGSVTWTSSDPEVATVVDGVVTAIKAGTVTITATNTKEKSATCTITVTEPPAVEQVLIVYISGAASSTVYITEDESNALKAAFLTASGLDAEAVTWNYLTGLNNANFNAAVNAAGNADIVISGANINKADQNPIGLHATYGKVSVGAGWFANESRYVAITADVAESHLDNAVALYNLVRTANPAE